MSCMAAARRVPKMADLDRAVATVVAEQGRIDVLVNNAGTIVNVSSIGGEIALPFGAWYYASKHALEAFSETLRMEVAPFGVRVVIIQPGMARHAETGLVTVRRGRGRGAHPAGGRVGPRAWSIPCHAVTRPAALRPSLPQCALAALPACHDPSAQHRTCNRVLARRQRQPDQVVRLGRLRWDSNHPARRGSGHGTRISRTGSPILSRSRATASAASVSGTTPEMERPRSSRPCRNSVISCATAPGADP
jgi:hypothetical protein